MASLTDEILIADLEENLQDDPYGTAMYVIANTLTRVLDDGVSGAMSNREYNNLEALAVLLTQLDPNYEPQPRLG